MAKPVILAVNDGPQDLRAARSTRSASTKTSQKPWDSPDQNLYPNLDAMLSDWQANYRPPFTGLRVIGYRWPPESHRTRDFLACNREVSVDSEPGQTRFTVRLPKDNTENGG